MFKQVLNIPDPRNSMPVSSTWVMGLKAVAQKQVFSPEEPSTFLPVNPSLKEALEKFEQDFKIANPPEGKFIKPSPEKWYKMVDHCFEEKIQDLNRDFVNICISPRPSTTPWGKVPSYR